MIGRAIVVTMLASTLLAGVQPARAERTPKAVDRARESVVRVVKTSGDKLKSVAVAVNDRGDFLTTSQAVSRTRGLNILIPGRQRPLPAIRVPSDARPGLELVHVPDAPRIRALRFAGRTPRADSTTWIVAPASVLSRPRRGKVLVPERLCTDGADAKLVSVGVKRVAGMNGSPVLDGRGRVLGLVRPNRSPGGGCTDEGAQVVLTEAAPQRLPPVVAQQRSDFPAVPLVVGLGVLLILANVVLLAQRRRALSLAEPLLTTHRSSDDGEKSSSPNAAAVDERGDDLEIRLRPKPDAPL